MKQNHKLKKYENANIHVPIRGRSYCAQRLCCAPAMLSIQLLHRGPRLIKKLSSSDKEKNVNFQFHYNGMTKINVWLGSVKGYFSSRALPESKGCGGRG